MKEKFETTELELPETIFIRDIESRVFQTIVFQAISKIKGVCLSGGTLIDNFLGRDALDRSRSVYVEQDLKRHGVKLKLEVNVEYGIPLPPLAEEIQTRVAKEVSQLTGLHVSSVHVVFKNLTIPTQHLHEEEKMEADDIQYSADFE